MPKPLIRRELTYIEVTDDRGQRVYRVPSVYATFTSLENLQRWAGDFKLVKRRARKNESFDY